MIDAIDAKKVMEAQARREPRSPWSPPSYSHPTPQDADVAVIKPLLAE